MNKQVFGAMALLLAAAASGCFAQTKSSNGANKSAAKKTAESPQKKANSIATPISTETAQTQIVVPSNPGAWTIEIRTSGGLTGAGIGNLKLVSDGNSILNHSDLNKKAAKSAALMSLSKTIATADFAVQNNSDKTTHATGKSDAPDKLPDLEVEAPRVKSVCNDCIDTTIVIRRREPDKSIKTFSAEWNESTAKEIAPDFQRIYQQATALKPLQPPTAKLETAEQQ